MSQIDHLDSLGRLDPHNYLDPRDPICGNDAGVVAKGSTMECPFRLCSPHPAIQVVILSNRDASPDRRIPPRMIYMANQAVREFELNPSQVVWIEHCSSEGSIPSSKGFNLIHFDWQAGQATSPHRSPIYEDWYLSWLDDNGLD